jgi:hypothetical protein
MCITSIELVMQPAMSHIMDGPCFISMSISFELRRYEHTKDGDLGAWMLPNLFLGSQDIYIYLVYLL